MENKLSPCKFMDSISKNTEVDSYLDMEVLRHPSLSSLSSIAFPEFAASHNYTPDHIHVFTDKSKNYYY